MRMEVRSAFPLPPSGQHAVSSAAALPLLSTTVFAGFLVTSLQLQSLEETFIIDLLLELAKRLLNVVVVNLHFQGSVGTQSFHLPFYQYVDRVKTVIPWKVKALSPGMPLRDRASSV